MLIGAAYVRVSTDDQLDLSPDSQLDEITKYAAANEIVTFSWSRKAEAAKKPRTGQNSSG